MNPNQKVTVKDLCDFFWEIEKKYRLFEWKYKDVYLWQIIRVKLFFQLAGQLCGYSDHQPAKNNFFTSLSDLMFSFLDFAVRNPFFGEKKKIIVMPLEREIEGEDIYTSQLLSELKDGCLVLDSPSKHKAPNFKSLKFIRMAAHSASKIASKLMINRADETIGGIEKDITAKFGLKVNLKAIADRETMQFKLINQAYRQVFRYHQPDKLYVVCSYYAYAAVKAAHDCGMTVTEIQHGLISPYHLGYSFPSGVTEQYLPDELWSFGRYWYESTPIPVSVKCRVVGSPYLRRLSEPAPPRVPGSVLFTSQGVLSKVMAKFALEFAEKNPDIKVILRLHPKDSILNYQGYKELPDNFEISHQKPNIYELLAAVEFQAAVFSTTVFEGLYLGTKIILLNMPGIENVHPLISRYQVPVVSHPEEMRQAMSRAVIVRDVEDFYADPVSRLT